MNDCSKGATVPDGPLAEEQILLVRMIHEHQRLAQDRAARSVMTAKQVPANGWLTLEAFAL